MLEFNEVASEDEKSINDFKKFSESFLSLDAYDKELDLFCTLAELGSDKTWKGRTRDRFYTNLYRITRRNAGRNDRSKNEIETWKNRYGKWRLHIDAFLWIGEGKNRKGATPTSFDATLRGSKRMQLLFELLKILDGKFSMLLTVNSVLVALVGVSLKEITDLFDRVSVGHVICFYDRVCIGPEMWFWIKWVPFFFLVGLLVLTIFHSFFNLWYAIRGFRRVVWGDLSACTSFNESEDEYSRFLIYSLARRTNLFRIVSESTRRAYRLFIYFVILTAPVLAVNTIRTMHADWLQVYPGHKSMPADTQQSPPANATQPAKDVDAAVPPEHPPQTVRSNDVKPKKGHAQKTIK